MRIATLRLFALAAAASFLCGCSTSQRSGPAATTSPSMPGIGLDSSGESHIIVFTAPTGGWSFSADRAEDVQGQSNVFVTMRRPNPRFVYPQMLVEHRIATQTPGSDRISVFARILEHDEPAGRGGYSLAAGSD